MFAVRSAMLLLALSLLLSPSMASASIGGSSGADGGAISFDLKSSTLERDDFSLTGETSVSRPVFRKVRLKAVLEESDHELEEADLGPIQVPREHNSHTSIAVSSPFFPRTCRLRC
jgi:hypothetical protein